MSSKPIDWSRFFYIMAMGITLVWFVYSIILLAYVFLIEGKRNRNKLKTRKGRASLSPEQEWEALSRITTKRCKDLGTGNPD
jgi:hypothetical protein